MPLLREVKELKKKGLDVPEVVFTFVRTSNKGEVVK